MLESLLTRHPDSLMVLAAPSHPDVRDRVSPGPGVADPARAARDQFDFIVVDTAPAFDDQTLTALDETDECVIVATLDVPTLKNVKVAIETLEMLNIARGPPAPAAEPGRRRRSASAPRRSSRSWRCRWPHHDRHVAWTSRPRPTPARPILSANPGHASSAALRELAGQLTGEPAAPAVASDRDRHRAEDDRASRRFRKRR